MNSMVFGFATRWISNHVRRARHLLQATRRSAPVTARRRLFSLVKTYVDAGGSFTRRVEKPVEASVIVSVDGVKAVLSDVSVDHATGTVTFRAGKAPPAGAAIRAGFEFDVPVRFAIDRIDVNLTAFEAGRIPSIPLKEILP